MIINILQEKWTKGYLSIYVEGTIAAVAQPLDVKGTDIK